MHRYLRSIGCSKLQDTEVLEALLSRAVLPRSRTGIMAGDREGSTIDQYQFPVSLNMGIAVVGERDARGTFHRDYYFPFLRSFDGTATEMASWERHTERETYEGILDDYASGISLIFYLTNSFHLREMLRMQMKPRVRQVFLTGLASEGRILLPIEKPMEDEEVARSRRKEEKKLYDAASKGDQDAIETITETEMNIMQSVSRRIESEDLYSVIDSVFMPTGVECDQYAIVGEIRGIRIKSNVFTHERVLDLRLLCNDCTFHVCINEADLEGVPAIGRRFKGRIWMQGEMEFTEEAEEEAKQVAAEKIPEAERLTGSGEMPAPAMEDETLEAGDSDAQPEDGEK